MKLGIVGTGMIAKEFLSILPQLQGIDCNAICGTPRSKEQVELLCKQYNIPTGVTEYTQLLSADVDTIYVALPNNLHYQFCLEALEADKNVIVEKPMTSLYQEATHLVSLAKQKNLFLYEAITNQYSKNYSKIKELLPQIGEIKLVHCNFIQYSSRYDAFCAGQLPSVFDPLKAGGALMDVNIYNIHFVVGLFGAPEKISYHANMDRGIDTSGVLVMNYPNFQAVCIAAKDCGAPCGTVINGTKGYMSQKSPSNVCGAVTLHLNNGSEETFDENPNNHRMIAEFNAFIKQINSGDRVECYQMLAHSLEVSKVLYEACQSAGIHFGSNH